MIIKLSKCYFALFCMLIGVLGLLSTSAFAVRNINLTSGEWPPYLSIDLPKGGIAAQMVSEAFALQGINTYYGYYPWKRSFEYARRGFGAANFTWHGSLVWIETKQRDQHFWFSDPIVSDKEILFSLKSKPVNWQKIEDLGGLRIGGTLFSAYPNLEKATKNNIIALEKVGDYQSLFERLLYKRIDAVALTKTVALHYMTHHLTDAEFHQITYSETLLEQRHYRLMLSKQHPENQHYLLQFNRGLAKLKASGRYAELLLQLESLSAKPLN
ncbi:transporter substrate-binding domain-containing protein [Agarivorans aestuarii]|uniref:Transporter substrate-binding domain-containing protein n=1 Tax=Agarivorans aestuarii TaxID=1563703 RepID=A0ABU7G6P9_9ALTE|nr:transporter substrate-binding domain-containing protein [Agarivorans aestuarii]MEE1674960.1 transporter substrate-binding domain-containing protein [Agarivorans aestuarii]